MLGSRDTLDHGKLIKYIGWTETSKKAFCRWVSIGCVERITCQQKRDEGGIRNNGFKGLFNIQPEGLY